ncbi:hypothetical protein BU16DRAFT_261661 [Lophium mytilinum]|uniref:Uncharacterized protein n=1 Tax=Lophium mytilinum TaxID=390894 RepID=A0A6A6R492_9PEZI|nr:hypothetical protein BU16DRAFT_261661 [Lophium mytilinum]
MATNFPHWTGLGRASTAFTLPLERLSAVTGSCGHAANPSGTTKAEVLELVTASTDRLSPPTLRCQGLAAASLARFLRLKHLCSFKTGVEWTWISGVAQGSQPYFQVKAAHVPRRYTAVRHPSIALRPLYASNWIQRAHVATAPQQRVPPEAIGSLAGP